MESVATPSAQDLFEAVAEGLTDDSRVTQGKMFGSSGLKVGAKFFAVLVKGSLVVKLPRDRVRALLATGGAEPFDPGMGRAMKEWVRVDPANRGEWAGLAREARAFVASL